MVWGWSPAKARQAQPPLWPIQFRSKGATGTFPCSIPLQKFSSFVVRGRRGFLHRYDSQHSGCSGRIHFHFKFPCMLSWQVTVTSGLAYFLKIAWRPIFLTVKFLMGRRRKQGCHRPWPRQWPLMHYYHPHLPELPSTWASRIAGCAYHKTFVMVIWTGTRCRCPHGRWVEECKKCLELRERMRKRHLERRV